MPLGDLVRLKEVHLIDLLQVRGIHDHLILFIDLETGSLHLGNLDLNLFFFLILQVSKICQQILFAEQVFNCLLLDPFFHLYLKLRLRLRNNDLRLRNNDFRLFEQGFKIGLCECKSIDVEPWDHVVDD